MMVRNGKTTWNKLIEHKKCLPTQLRHDRTGSWLTDFQKGSK
jgi:hypothetical protein